MTEQRLHITNGDTTVSLMRRGGITDPILPWRDVLHDGPCPDGVPLALFSQQRASYLASCGSHSFEQVHRKFVERDRLILRANDFEEIVLWFEHDLYDQLQLIQILDLLQDYRGRLLLINTGTHLGTLKPEDFQSLLPTASVVSDVQVNLAIHAWSMFRAKEPMGLWDLYKTDPHQLHYLTSSLHRLLQEYPSVKNGLPRTESQILTRLMQSSCSFNQLFEHCGSLEDARYMGDWSFQLRIDALAAGDTPLVVDSGDALRITKLGAMVLDNKKDWTRVRSMDRYIGGVHLKGYSPWRWDTDHEALTVRDT